MVNVSEGMPLTLTSIKGNFSLQSLPLLLLLALRLLLLILPKQGMDGCKREVQMVLIITQSLTIAKEIM